MSDISVLATLPAANPTVPKDSPATVAPKLPSEGGPIQDAPNKPAQPMLGNIPLPFTSGLQTEIGVRTEKRSAFGAFLDDVHVNLSGAVLFGCAIGAIWFPAHKQEFAETATAASMYLFASAKAK